MNGVLIIDKPKGWTSHDVVAWIRKVLGVKKAGHGGTLDPLATGVLLIYLNEGTKLAPFNLESTKEYLATMKLGQETDTLDADGKIIAQNENIFRTPQEIEEVLGRFRGAIRQVPPLFSALKRDGRPLYKHARAGDTPPMGEREVKIHALVLKEVLLPLVTVEITCSRGTYIRSLCADIGRALGCGAHVSELRRVRVGKFTIQQALSLESISQLVQEKKVAERVLPLKDGVDIAETIWVEKKIAQNVRQGRPIFWGDLAATERCRLKKGHRVSLLEDPNELLAIAESQVDGGSCLLENPKTLQILRVFNSH